LDFDRGSLRQQAVEELVCLLLRVASVPSWAASFTGWVIEVNGGLLIA
jgi:hypothetical protein